MTQKDPFRVPCPSHNLDSKIRPQEEAQEVRNLETSYRSQPEKGGKDSQLTAVNLPGSQAIVSEVKF